MIISCRENRAHFHRYNVASLPGCGELRMRRRRQPRPGGRRRPGRWRYCCRSRRSRRWRCCSRWYGCSSSCRAWSRRRCWRGCRTHCSGAVSPAGVEQAEVISAPDDHFAAGPDPDRRVKPSCGRRVGGAGGCPRVRDGVVPPAGIKVPAAAVSSAPDNHFAASPHCRVAVSDFGRVGGAGGCPTVSAGIIPSSRVKIDRVIRASPNDHFAVSPHCRVAVSGFGRVGGAGGAPTVGVGIVPPARVKYPCWDGISHRCRRHQLHPKRSFHCRSRLPCGRIGQRARSWCWWLSNCRCLGCTSRQC